MKHLKQYITVMSQQEKLDLVNSDFHPRLFKRKVSKKRLKMFLGKRFYFKKDDLHISYKIHRISFKQSIQHEITIIKEIKTPEGIIFNLVDDSMLSLNSHSLFFVNHAVTRYQERLNIESYDEALKKFISEFGLVYFEDGEKEQDFRARIDSGLLFGNRDEELKISLIKTFIATDVLNKKKAQFKKELDEVNNQKKDIHYQAMKQRADLLEIF